MELVFHGKRGGDNAIFTFILKGCLKREVSNIVTSFDEKQAEIIPIEKMLSTFFHTPDPDNAGVGIKDNTE